MRPFELLLFSVDPDFIPRAAAAGVDGIIVDLESRGKERRQAGADTEVNHNTLDDLRRARAATRAPVICRINEPGPDTPAEVEAVIERGADEVLLPMVRGPGAVEAVLDQVAGRCGVGILVETEDAVERASELGRLPLARAYVGLNDLAIDRGSPGIFEAVRDGTVERVRAHFEAPFGFGGLTRPDAGDPIPCRLLMGEMARLDCAFSFLRRSFYRDTAGRELDVEVPRIARAVERAAGRSSDDVECDRRALEFAIREAYPVGLASTVEG